MGYWKDFEDMELRFAFEAYDERSGYSEGEEFDDLQGAVDAFDGWAIEEGGAASEKHVTANVYVPTERGELDLFKTFELMHG